VEFKYDGRIIEAKITHEYWLKRYQEGLVPISPGDSLKAWVTCQVSYGYDNEIVAKHYWVTEVLGMIHPDRNDQQKLFYNTSNSFARISVLHKVYFV
jgi:hypothetical protein